MSDPTLVRPLRYEARYEQPEAGESELIAELTDLLRGVAEKVARDTGHAMRAVHAKNHGLLRGVLRIPPGLPPQLAQGLLARPASYDVVMRLSTIAAEELPDSVSLPRGLALQVLRVPGARLPGSETDSVQDFIFVNETSFGSPDLRSFVKAVKLVAATTDRSPAGKQLLSAVLRGAEKAIEAIGSESPKLKALGGHPPTHPLGETFYTQLPLLYGDYMAKLCLAPLSPALQALTGRQLDLKDRPDALREAVAAFLADATEPLKWELRAQLCSDLDKMPLEGGAAAWPEDISPFIAVATVVVPKQAPFSTEQLRQMDDRLAFNPWHGLAAHRPLGALMRARRAAYAASSEFRARFNGCPVGEWADN
jgi:hypothetical protein